jgi:hypothetical protein
MRYFALAWMILLVPLLLCGTAGLTFEGETLVFTLSREAPGSDSLVWLAQGDYYFSNLSNDGISSPIAFPIPSGNGSEVAVLHDLALIDPADSMAVELLRQHDQGLLFTLKLPANSFAHLRLSYSQIITGAEAVYILKSANTWGRALPYCGIELLVEEGLKVSVPGFPGPRIQTTDGCTSWQWDFTNIVFSHDFRITLK